MVEVSGEIDLATVSELRSAIEEAVGQVGGPDTPPVVVMDLSEVSFIEIMGVGLLVEQKGKLRERGGDLRLVLGEGRVGEILRLLDLEGVFAIYPDLKTAIEDSGENA